MFRFDHTDPKYLIMYTGNGHAVPDDYRDLGRKWAEGLAKGERFGVIVVYEPHDHDESEHDEDRDRQYEAEITRITNDFRRDYRDQTARINVGWARVYLPEWKDMYYGEPGAWDNAQEGNERYAQYSWGIPGRAFFTLDEAKSWIDEQFQREPVAQIPDVTESEPLNQSVGLYYGSSTGVTEDAAYKIKDAWHAAGMSPLTPVNIGAVKDAAQLLTFEYLLLGIPTWNIGELQDDWDILFPQLDTLDFSGKKIAMFGIGDQYNYPDNFLDALGILGKKLRERGAELFGFWPTDGYEFAASLALEDGQLMGVGIDNYNQPRLTSDRVTRWVAQVIQEFALQPSVAS